MAHVEETKKKTESVVAKAKRCWKLAIEADAAQREREREDIAFQIPENQWTEQAKKSRKGRPMLSVSLLRQPMQLVQNQAAAAQLGVDIHPVNENATDELAEIKQGIYRRIERDSNAEQARLWALDRAKQCGRGWYRVNTQWDEDGDDEWDQEIVIQRILHQEAVYIDPTAEQPDFSDAEWAFVSTWVPLDRFRREFPDAKISESGDTAFADMVEKEPEWVRIKNGKQAVHVVEYFYKVHDYKEVENQGRKRKKDSVTVHWCKLTGCEPEPLESTVWPGRHIPLIPVIGLELQPIEGERRWEGMVRSAMDAQRIYNHAISSVVEDVSRVSKAPYVGAHGQFEGFEDDWRDANVTNLAFLQYNAKVDGMQQPLPPPQPVQIDGSKMQLSMALAEQGKQLVQSATAIFDPSLGRDNPREKSGRAILALQQQADAGSSHYTQNLAKVSMRYEAMVVLDLMPKVYDRPGRITRVLGGEDETRTVMLGAPFITDPNTGQPVPVETDAAGNPMDPNAKVIDLTRGKYSLSVTIGKSQQTRLQEGAEEVGKILEAAPELMIPIGPTYFRFRDFPGANEIADILKQMREKQFPGLGAQKEGQMDPEQLKAQLDAANQQMQEMQQVMQQMQQAIETDQAKQQATMAKAQMDNEARVQIAQLDNQTRVLIAQLTAEIKAAIEDAKGGRDTQVQAQDHAHATRTEREQRAHEVGQQESEHRHERELQREKGMLDIAKQGMQVMQAEASAEADREHSDRERHEGMAHDAAMAAGKGVKVEYKREGGQEAGREEESEQSRGFSRAPKAPKETK